MKKYFWLIILGVLIVIIVWGVRTYNTLTAMGENIKNAQAQVEVHYQRRFKLIPNLVNSVQGIFDQEQAVFIALAEARKGYVGTREGTPERIAATNEVQTVLGRLLVIVENYPELRSAENVTRLMDELAGTENRIATERKRYNDTVTAYNKKVKFFPSKLIANVFDFAEQEILFESTAGAENAPSVEFK